MMMKSYLSFKHGAAVAVALAIVAAALPAHAITIRVQKGGTAPYLYAYLGSGDNATKLTGEWPGTQLTEKTSDNKYWTYTIDGQSTVNIVFNMGGDTGKTNDFLNISGVDGVASFMYDGQGGLFGTMPTGVTYNEKSIYFIKAPTWGTTYAIARTSGGGYEKQKMTYVGKDGAGLEVYTANFAHWDDTPNTVEFTDDVTSTGELAYKAGGYYDTSKYTAEFVNVTGNSFDDANFVSAIRSYYGFEGDVFAPATVTILDVSNKGITSLTGIEKFTNLIELYASDNNLQKVYLDNNANLEVLDLSNNDALVGFSSSSNGTVDGYISVDKTNNSLRTLILKDMGKFGYFQALVNTYKQTGIEKLIVSNCSGTGGGGLGWSTAVTSLTKLKYLDWSSNKVESSYATSLDFSAQTSLEYLNMSGNSNIKGFSKLPSSLLYLDVHNCGFSSTNRVALSTVPNLIWLDASGNTGLDYVAQTSYAKKLEHLDIHGCDLDIATQFASNTINSSTHKALRFVDISYGSILTRPVTFEGYAALDTLIVGNVNKTVGKGNNTFPSLTIKDCPNLKIIDLNGLTSSNLTTIAIDNDYSGSDVPIDVIYGENDLPGLTTLDLSGNNYAAVPSIDNFPSTVVNLNLNSNKLTDIDATAAPGVKFLYAQDNNFAAEYKLGNTGNLVGIDLGNNGFTSFKAEKKPATLTALGLGNNTSLTTLELHGNEGLTRTASDATMSDGSGVYLLGCSALESIDIADSYFDHIGQASSLKGLTAVKKLKANNNKFTTFTNSNYDIKAFSLSGVSIGNERSASLSTIAGKPSLEDLTGLEELDLRNNLLEDSVHLWRNTELRRLDISGNQRFENDYRNGTDAEKKAARIAKATRIVKYGDHYKKNASDTTTTAKSIGTEITITDAILAANVNPHNGCAFELRDKDLRDTIGVYHLDLNFNTKLEYLNISRTAIRNTASTYHYMIPGWEGTNHATSIPHSFVWAQPASGLKVIHADDLNLQSNGFMYYPELDTLTQAGMYGDCAFMGKSINMSNTVRKWNGQTYSYTNNKFTSTNKYLGGDGNTYTTKNVGKDANGKDIYEPVNPYPNPIKYWDVRYSDYDSIGTNAGVSLERLYADKNPIKTLNITHNKAIIDAFARDCSSATVIDAHDLANLATLDLSMDDESAMAAKHIFACNDPALPEIKGLSGLADLELLYVYNDQLMGRSGNIAVGDNKKLRSLWASNCDLSSIDLNNNTVLDTLRCYDNLPLTALAVSNNKQMRHLDFARCAVEEINLSNNAALEYFDCSNDENKGHNLIVDLDFSPATGIKTIYAGYNDLHAINGVAGKTDLICLSFPHNHVNGIDLSGCTGFTWDAIDQVVANNNGRAITAEGVKVAWKDGDEVKEETFFYYQLDSSSPDKLPTAADTFIGTKTSLTSSSHNVITQQTRVLGDDNFAVGNIISWNDNAYPYEPIPSADAPRRAAPNTDVLKADQIKGTVVFLDDSDHHTTYTYNTGNDAVGNLEFYLDWTAAANIVTAIDNVAAEADVESVTYYNPAGQQATTPFTGVNIVVTRYTDGTQKTTKVVF